MADVDGITLMMAIQAVDAKIVEIDQDRHETHDASAADLDELLLSYTLAAEQLKKAYLTEASRSSNLPPYEVLVPDSL